MIVLLFITAPVWIIFVGAYVIENGIWGLLTMFVLIIALASASSIPRNGWMKR